MQKWAKIKLFLLKKKIYQNLTSAYLMAKSFFSVKLKKQAKSKLLWNFYYDWIILWDFINILAFLRSKWWIVNFLQSSKKHILQPQQCYLFLIKLTYSELKTKKLMSKCNRWLKNISMIKQGKFPDFLLFFYLYQHVWNASFFSPAT